MAVGLDPWRQRGLCQETDPEIFFPKKGGSTKPAKTICGRCEVRTDCLAWALENDEPFGIWGGLSVRERARLKNGRVKPATARDRQIQQAKEMYREGVEVSEIAATFDVRERTVYRWVAAVPVVA